MEMNNTQLNDDSNDNNLNNDNSNDDDHVVEDPLSSSPPPTVATTGRNRSDGSRGRVAFADDNVEIRHYHPLLRPSNDEEKAEEEDDNDDVEVGIQMSSPNNVNANGEMKTRTGTTITQRRVSGNSNKGHDRTASTDSAIRGHHRTASTDSAFRGQCAMVRQSSYQKACSSGERKRKILKNFLTTGTTATTVPLDINHHSSHHDPSNNSSIDEVSDGIKTSKHGRYLVSRRDLLTSTFSFVGNFNKSSSQLQTQYCLNAVKPKAERRPKILRWLGLGDTRLTIYDDATEKHASCLFCGINPNVLVIKFFHWIFRQAIFTVIFTAGVGFFSLTILFALFIWKAGLKHPECIRGVDGYDNDYFIDAFALSWTTFSTVGYGLVYSGISADVANIRKCTAITVIVTFEAFVGVLFSSIWGAILFVKISRIQSFAQVIFSDVICIRYGSGVKIEQDDDDADEDGNASLDSSQSGDNVELEIPCPILEFRVVNRMHNISGGEIIDSTVNVVASIDASQASHVVRDPTFRRRRGKKGKKGARHQRGPVRNSHTMRQSAQSKFPSISEDGGFSSSDSLPDLESREIEPSAIPQTVQSFEEDPTGHIVPKTILSKLDCDTQDHPFFKRVWIIRHTLDDNSPLLTAQARQKLRLCRGFWPKELNNAEAVRKSISFEQLVITLSGTSNADANSVYAQKVYDFADVNVGYRFVNMLYRNNRVGALKVDTNLINDVMEQAGGGGEPFCADRIEQRNSKKYIFSL